MAIAAAKSRPEAATGRAPARAALVGNPSDGYGGATLAIAIADFAAEVAIERSAARGAPIVEPPSELITATLQIFGDIYGSPEGARVSWKTTIPREVGLAGSSALVIASLRALCALAAIRISPARMAALALKIEVETLGIAAGLQDRVALAYGGLMHMDFDARHFAEQGCGHYESLPPRLLPPLYVAYREDAAQQSGAVHGSLRERFDARDPVAVTAMRDLKRLTHEARDALEQGDHELFGVCVDASFDVRARLIELDSRHVSMIEAARSAGASANYTGSGGAIAGSCRDAPHVEEVLAALADAGAAAFAPTIEPAGAA